MHDRLTALALVLIATVPIAAADEFEELLLDKFNVQNQSGAERLRALAKDTVDKAKEFKESDPDRGIELLRGLNDRIDGMKLLNTAERRAIADLVQPVARELRDRSLLKRREKASERFESFKGYLEATALEGCLPGRSGFDAWEPASFWAPDGHSRLGKIVSLGTGAVAHKVGDKEEFAVPLVMPLIQVFGGFYVYDKGNAHHVFLTNREFYDSVWSRLLNEYLAKDVSGQRKLTAAETALIRDNRRLQASIDNGVYFLRALPSLDSIPGVGNDEDSFLSFVAQTLAHKRMPLAIDQIYPRELRERLDGFSAIQLSATHRALALLKARDAAVSPFDSEFMRNKATELLKSEYTNFSESETNRATSFLFSKLK